MTLEDVLKWAERLDVEQQERLISLLHLQRDRRLAGTFRPVERDHEPTREELILESATLRASRAFHQSESLYGKYADSKVPDMNEAEFHAQLHAIATEWEQELSDFV